MSTHQTTIINTRIKGIPFTVQHIYSSKKEFNGRSHWIASELAGKTFNDRIYFHLTDHQIKKYSQNMLKEATIYMKHKTTKGGK